LYCRGSGARPRSTPGECVEIDVSTLVDWVGAAAASLALLVEAIRRHVLAAHIHSDDTTVPVLAEQKTVTGRLWIHVRDDRPFRRRRPVGNLVLLLAQSRWRTSRVSSDRLRRIMQADAHAGFTRLNDPSRKPGRIIEAACWAQAAGKVLRAGQGRQGTDAGGLPGSGD